MKATSCLRAVQPDYIDVDVYLAEEDGSEWNLSIFKEMETGKICFGDYRWAKDEDASFEEPDKEPSAPVWIAVIEEMPQVLAIIEEAEKA